VCDAPKKQGSFVFDLRFDPREYADLSAEQLADKWRWKKDSEEPRLPIKVLAYNKCPAVAPLGVLDDASKERIKLDMQLVRQHAAALAAMPSDFTNRLCRAAEIIEKHMQTTFLADERHVDGQLYDGFIPDHDKQIMSVIRAAAPNDISELQGDLSDPRLQALLPLYKARNFPRTLSGEEREVWDAYCKKQLLHGGQHSRMARFLARLQDIAAKDNLTDHQSYLLEELKLYAESIMPEQD